MRRHLLIILAVLLAIPIVATAYDVGYGYEGSFTFNCSAVPACPANMSYAFVSMAAGGGSGKSTTWGATPNQNLFGYGGNAGEYGNYTMVPIVYTADYTIVVGGHGDTNTVYNTTTSANDGGDTTAFGYTKHGGTAGGSGYIIAGAGGNGQSTNFYTTYTHPSAILAVAGGNSGIYTGGLAGTGKGAGGGGAASNSSLVYDVGQAIGGNGGDGIVYIWEMNASGSNIPGYTASPTTAGIGSIITFTDNSILNDGVGLSYLWDFGDGSTSTVNGTVTHVYSSYGVFSTNLTITSSTGTVSLPKPNYITITNVPITAWYTQKLVRLKTVDAYGNDLVGTNITVNYISNSLPSKDTSWLTSAFGISQAVANQMVNGSVAMQGMSGSDGSVTFTMFPAIEYGITITNNTLGLSKYVTVYPQDNDYVIYCPLGSQAEPISRITHMYNTSLYVTEPNASWITWNIYYQDTSGYTTGLTWNVTCWNNMTEMYNKTWGAVGASTILADNYTFPSVPAGVEYRAVYQATRDIP